MRISHEYDDIIELPHHQSATHPQMSLHDRAAQFAPFAALVGYDDAVAETARGILCTALWRRFVPGRYGVGKRTVEKKKDRKELKFPKIDTKLLFGR